jgi:hypothetical protein
MRTALCIAFGLGAVVAVVPAAFAQSAGTGVNAEERQPRGTTGISLEVPIGRVSVGPALGGEPVYVRRTTVKEGMTIVEVSTTPFTPVLASNEGPPVVGRSDQPAGW